MRIQQVKEKVKERVPIPKGLKQFLKEVYESILEKDEATTIPSDDLLQDAFIYGGLNEEGGGEYGFTYFPKMGTKWELNFTVDQLKGIYKDRTTHLDLWTCASKDCKCRFHSKDMTCFHCDYEEDGNI